MELSDLFLLLPALVGFWVLVSRKRHAPPAPPPAPVLPEKAIVVDGSNVLHWAGEPALPVLNRVLQDLIGRGYAPIVFFDANVGYVIGDSYLGEAGVAPRLDLSPDHICVVDKGVVADQAILSFATDYGLRIITNDRYRDWRVAFPRAAQKGVLVGGTWREGTVIWRGSL